MDNHIQIERAIMRLIIDPSKYQGNQPVELEIIGEYLVITYWWIGFLITFFHVSISSFIYSFITA